MLSSDYNGYSVNLIESVEELQGLRSHVGANIAVGIDTETTGLSYVSDRVVGVCVALGESYLPKDYKGYYIPVRHEGYSNNLPIDPVIWFVQWLVDNFKTCWWNRSFDFSMLELDGFKAPFIGKTVDGQIMEYLATSENFPKLKDAAAKYLKFEVMEFESNNAKDHNFGTTDPRLSYRYAAQDPLITTLVSRHIWNSFPYIHKIFPVDNRSGEAMRKFSMTSILPLDFGIIQREYDRITAELARVKQQIFAITGYEFRLTSPRDKADALSRFVTLTARTKTGNFQVNDEVLSSINHPLARLMQEFNGLEKFRSTYVQKMLDFPKEGMRISYQTTSTQTGRISSGGAKDNDYFASFNIQNVPKVEVMRYVHTDDTLGYVVNDEPEGAICMMKVKGGLRDAFICPEGYVWISADYSAQEMRVMANLSGEPNLINPLLSGEDIHNYIAKQMFGFADKHHRTRVKVLNFSVNYGAGSGAIADKLGISRDEAQALLDKYNGTLASLTRWKKDQQATARRKGILFTYFGRPRVVWKYYASSDTGMRAFGDRTAVNSPVQGFGGDLIRMDHARLWQKMLDDPEFAENVKYSCTVHDEIDLYVKPAYLRKAMATLRGIMDFSAPNLRVPIETSPSVGLDWGSQVECDDISPNNRIIINREKCEPLEGDTEVSMNAKLDAWEHREDY